MSDLATRPIWQSDTGITDLQGDAGARGASEISGIKAIWADQRTRLAGTAQLVDFTERLGREWAIETGIIENLYDIDRGVTQTLIEHGFHTELLSHGATNKPREHVLRLLRDQKEALDGVFDFVKSERSLSVSYIKELHAALLRSQDTTEAIDAMGRTVEVPLIKGDWKKLPNYPIRDGVTYTYCPPEHVAAEMDRLVELHNHHIEAAVPSDVQSAWLHHRFTQIHPFQDGNGRVARAIASLVLVKGGLFPLVVTRDDKPRYIHALEMADGGVLQPLIALVARLQGVQFRKAIAISEALLGEQDVGTVLEGLLQTAEKVGADRLASMSHVFSLAGLLENDLDDRLRAIAPTVATALQRAAGSATALVRRSTAETDDYFRAQIIDNARRHLGYFANCVDYRAWVALTMRWSRRAQLVFAIHGFGQPFNGSLVCAPFLEFKDKDEDGQDRATLVPVADEGFVFFHTEEPERLLARFAPWREAVLTTAIAELTRNL